MLLSIACAVGALSLPPQDPQDQGTDRSSAPTSHLGAYMGTVDALDRPVAATFGPAGDERNALWVAEAGSATAPAGLRALSGIDASFEGHRAGRTIARIGVGVLDHPTGIAVDGTGVVFATDDATHTVWRFAPNGEATKLATRGGEVGQVLFPADIEIWPNHGGPAQIIAVADAGNRRIQLLDVARGAWIPTSEASDLVTPSAVAFIPPTVGGGAGEQAAATAPAQFLVADAGRQKIDIFNLDGSYHSSFSDGGFFPSLVSFPRGLACREGLFFVADTDNHRIQAFEADRPGDPNDGLRYRFGVHAIRPGEGDGSLHYPSDLAIDRDAMVMAVVEPLDDRIQIFGRAQGATPKHDPTRAGLGAPAAHLGPLISASGAFLVTLSPESHRVVAHDLRGEQPVKICEMFSFGERLGMVREPVGVDLSEEGSRLLVTDSGNRRLTRARLQVAPEEPIKQDPELDVTLDSLDLDAFGILPGDVALVPRDDGDPWIAVVDRGTDGVAVFSWELELVGRIPSPGQGAYGITGLCSTPAGTLLMLYRFRPRAGKSPGEDLARGIVFEVTTAGELLGSFGEGLLVEPGAALVPGDRAFVTDASRDSVEIFERNGDTGAFEHVRGFGETGLGRSQFQEPRGLGWTGDGRVVVLDHGNHRGQIFGLEGNFLSGFGGRLYTAPLRAKTR